MSNGPGTDSNVIKFPRKAHWLLALAPPLLKRGDAYIGLIEAVAWVGSRSRRVSDAVRWHLHMREHERDDLNCHWLAIWTGLGELLEGEGCGYVSWAADELIDAVAVGDLVGFGCFGDDDEHKEMEPRHWIGARVGFQYLDSIEPKASRFAYERRPRWHMIQFLRADIEQRWPELQEGESEKVRKRGRPGYASDEVLFLKMAEDRRGSPVKADGERELSITNAALAYGAEAEGLGDPLNKAKRLERNYSDRHRADPETYP